MNNTTATSVGTTPGTRYNDAEAAIIIIVLVLMSIAATFGNILTFVAYYKVRGNIL